MKTRPLHDPLLAKPFAEVAKTTDGLLFPDTAKEKPHEAVVKPGDRIVIGKRAGSDVKVDGDEHIILGED